MANYSNFQICSNYKQIEAACLMVSLGTIIEYFTERKKQVGSILNDYQEKFFELPQHSNGQRQMTLEKAVKDHVHGFCTPIDMRGAKYIEKLHLGDEISTLGDCKLISCEAPTPQAPINDKLIQELKTNLESKDSLALIIYATSSGMHTVVVGFDSEKGVYFCKDPNENSARIITDFPKYDIYEFALFIDNNEE
jgi:hypothetical protein